METYIDSNKLIDSLEEIIKTKKENKEKNSLLFKEIVLDTYETEIGEVTNLFRELHDSLHFKEVQIKREIKSYFDTNNEVFTKEISLLDYEIEKLNQLIDSIKILNENNILIAKNNDIDSKKLLDKFFIEYNSINSEIIKKKIMYQDLEYFHTIKIAENSEIKSAIDTIHCRHFSTLLDPNYEVIYKNYNRIYRFVREKGLFEMNLMNNEIINILASDSDIKSPNLFSSRFYQNNNVGNIVYIFGSDDLLYILNTLDSHPHWKTIEMPFKSVTNISSIFDNNKFIYLFGGYNKIDKLDRSDIFQYNIETEEFKKVGDLEHPSLGYNLTLSGEEIHLIGGIKNNTYFSSILTFNTVNHTCKTLFLPDTLPPQIILIEAGCYVHKIDAYFIYTQTAHFYIFSSTFKTVVQLEPPNDAKKAFYAKLIYDNDNKIFLFSKGESKIYVYNIETESWTSNHFENLQIMEADYISF